MLRSRFRLSLCRKSRFLQRYGVQNRRLYIFHVPKDGSTSLPISTIVNENRDIVYRFVEDGVESETLTFAEEPCGMTADHGLGFLQVDFGERFGPDGRFEILRKLGYGETSSVWLARDIFEERFVAIKALTGYETRFCKTRINSGYDVSADISNRKSALHASFQNFKCPENHLLSEIGRFIEAGKDEEDGEHLCFVTNLLGPTFDQVLRKLDRKHRKPLIKRMLRHTLIGLSHLHSLGIVHTDLHDRNILMDLGNKSSTTDIESFVKNEPAQRYPSTRTWGGKQTAIAVSQPFPVPSGEECMTRDFLITDFVNAQYVDRQSANFFTEPTLRAPELILGLPWDEKIDIWAFGCMVFELNNYQSFIKPSLPDVEVPYEILSLAQMLSFTNERLPADTIFSSETAMKYLDPYTGWLNDGTTIVEFHVTDLMKRIGVLREPGDLFGVNELLRKCLRLDSKDRLSAVELLEDPWLNTET